MCKEKCGVPESEWTKNQRDFVGAQFPTPKGGILTVTGVVGKQGSNAIFNLECSICSKDTELWPVGSIKSTKRHLKGGKVSCGCASKTNWTEEQFKIRVQRECDKREYIFHGWSEDFKGKNTKLDLVNTVSGNRWQSTSIDSFFSGCGDPVAARQALLIPEEQHIDEFHKVGFEGCTFWRSDRKDSKGWKNYWYYTCPTCSNDEYVIAGLCSGVFESQGSKLKVGQKACRCNKKNYPWTQEQREYQLTRVCKEDGFTFKGWETEEGYTKNTSKFKWLCSEDHECMTGVSGFLDSVSRCRTCSKHGYDPSKDGSLYLVEWFGYGKSYLKKGITNNSTISRIRNQNGKSKLDYRIIREIHSEDGKAIQEYEKFLNSHFEGSACPKELLPDGYTETVHNTPENFKLLMEFFDKFEEELAKSDKQNS